MSASVNAAMARTAGSDVFEDLQDKVAVVTGGARGLGLQIARALASQGVSLALLDLLPEVKDSAQTVAEDFGVRSLGLQADVTDEDSIAATFARVGDTLGTPTILVNAAGITVWDDSVSLSRASWQRVLDINLTGTFLCCQALARACMAAGRPGAGRVRIHSAARVGFGSAVPSLSSKKSSAAPGRLGGW